MPAEYLPRSTELNLYQKEIARKLAYKLRHSNGRQTNLYWLIYTKEGKKFSESKSKEMSQV